MSLCRKHRLDFGRSRANVIGLEVGRYRKDFDDLSVVTGPLRIPADPVLDRYQVRCELPDTGKSVRQKKFKVPLEPS